MPSSLEKLESTFGAQRLVVKILVGADQTRRLRAADIASRASVRISPMPEGLLNALTQQQIADLLEYLSTLK